MSIAGKTKQVTCIECGEIITVSLYASAKTAKCNKCKKISKSVHSKVSVQDGNLEKLKAQVNINMQNCDDCEKLKEKCDSCDRITIEEHRQELHKAINEYEPDPSKYMSLDEHQDIVKHIGVDGDIKPLKVLLQRNRSEIEGHVIMNTGEIIERVPTEYKPICNELDYLSVSKIETYERCPAQFYHQYMNVENPEEDNGNIFTWFGTILHEVTEVVERAYKDMGITMDPLSVYDEAWRKQPLNDFQMYKQGRDLLADYFSRHPIGSSTDTCIAIEYEFRGSLFDDEPDLIFGCMFDYVGEIDNETAILKDYKTNRHPYTQWELENSLQLSVYELILRKLYPKYKKWITGYEMFFFDWQQCPPRSDEDLIATENYIKNIWHKIKNDNTWEERINDYCSYCNRRYECKAYCKLMQNPKGALSAVMVDKNDLSSIEQARETLSAYEKIFKRRKDELSNLMKTAVEEAVKRGESIVVDGQELYLQVQSRPKYDYYTARDIMAVHGKINELDKCLTINKTKMDKIIKDNPQIALEMSKAVVQTYSAPYLMKRKYKGGGH